jgi:hypothetical protein
VIGTCLAHADIQQILKRSAIRSRDGAYDYETQWLCGRPRAGRRSRDGQARAIEAWHGEAARA